MITYLFSCKFFSSFLGVDADATDDAFRRWVGDKIANNTSQEERLQYKTVPNGLHVSRIDVTGCVHRVNAMQLNRVIESFNYPQWAFECERHNEYAGALVEVCGSQSEMSMFTHKIGPFRL